MRRVFIVHGHDHIALYRLKDWVNGLGVKPVVLWDEPNAGLTVIEKFERHASQSEFAVALLTPDDKQAQDLCARDKKRARQNVILEVGWFMAKLGRNNVILVHKGDVELPSDILGIIFLEFKESITEVFDAIRAELTNQGIV